MKKLLAVFDTDTLYASRLMEYFKRSNWDDFEIILFTKQESLVDFLKYQAVDILLFGGDTLSEEISRENIKYVFWICTDNKQAKDKQDTIYKYQAAGKIGSDIFSRYTKLENNYHSDSLDNLSIISFFAPVPSEEKISYAWSRAKELSYRRKVLFIDLEQLPVTIKPWHENSVSSMSELLYFLKEGNPNYIDKLYTYLNYSDKLSYLAGPTHGFDLLSLCREDMGRLMDDLKKYTDYETVILYLGIYTEASMEALSRSNDIYILANDLNYDELVEKEWERQMELMGIQINKLNIKRIRL